MSSSNICQNRLINLDITSIASENNKAAKYLIDLLIRNKDEYIFIKIKLLLSKVDTKFKYLFENGIFSNYMYDLVYNDYKSKIEEKINEKYQSFVLNIMRTKYKTYLEKIKKLYDNYDDDDNDNDYVYHIDKVNSDNSQEYKICEYDEESFHGFS
jgi:hypothetical protein